MKRNLIKKLKAMINESQRYPKTAAEYAQILNSKQQNNAFQLVDDQEFWEQMNVVTGEDLARHLAIEAYHNAYKECYGFRPRGKNFNVMSIEEIEAAVDDIYDNCNM